MAPLWPGRAGFTLTSPRCHRREFHMQAATPSKPSWFSPFVFTLKERLRFTCRPPAFFFSSTKAFDHSAEVNFAFFPVRGVAALTPWPHLAAYSNKQLLNGRKCLHIPLLANPPNFTRFRKENVHNSARARAFFYKKAFIYPIRGKFYIFICEQFSSSSCGRVVMSHRGKLMWIINIQSWCWLWINQSCRRRRRRRKKGMTRQWLKGGERERDVKSNLQIQR